MKRPKRPLIAALTICLGMTASAGTLPLQQASSESLSFEVASIKPNPTPGGGTTLCHGMDSAMPPGSPPPLGRCMLTRRGLVDIISWAYDIQYPLITGGPAWAVSDKFDIEAKAEDPTQTNREKFQLMLRTLLVDQFKLTFHRETRETSGFELTVAKGGPKLAEASGKLVPQGIFVSPARNTITGNGSTVKRLVVALSLVLEGTIVDKTSLTGIYDFRLQWSPQLGERGYNPKNPKDDLSGPSLFSAIQDQLGLRLESKKVPTEIFVIDHAEKPPEGNQQR